MFAVNERHNFVFGNDKSVAADGKDLTRSPCPEQVYQHLSVKTVGEVHEIMLCRPTRRNALVTEMLLELKGEFDRIENDPNIKAVVLTGEGDFFCSGQDLDEIARRKRDDLGDVAKEMLTHYYEPLVQAMWNSSQFIVAAVNGPAVGAGMSLVFACDRAVFSRDATLIPGFTKVGLCPDAGASLHLLEMFGASTAKTVTLLNRPITAEQANTTGCVEKIVSKEDVLSSAHQFALEIAKTSKSLISQIKWAFNSPRSDKLLAFLRAEVSNQINAARSQLFGGVIADRQKKEDT